ncbi:MAG: FecR domain-containing protein [candidate division KSB1 bacterium]|nr:FecR domain-containing protein [candidate division KSB1 bacterium]
MREKKRLQFIARYLSGKKSKRFSKFARKVESDTEFFKELSQMKSIWDYDVNLVEPKPAEEMWQDFQKRLRYEKNPTRRAVSQYAKRRRISRYSFAYAFAIIVLLLLPLSIFVYNNVETTEQTVQYSEIRVPHGQRHTLQLSDGTRIILDSGSYLRYPSTFSNKRVVYLKGEAFFEVTRNPRKPFIVHANKARVQVLGTKFNIRAWEPSHKVEVAVKEGLVSLQRADSTDAKMVYIEKNQISILEDQNPPIEPMSTDISHHLGWMQNEIRFESASIGQVFEQLQRWYEYNFVISDSSILQQKVTVHILNTNVEDVLQIMGRLTGSCIEREGNQIRFIEK